MHTSLQQKLNLFGALKPMFELSFASQPEIEEPLSLLE
jgi:hypothetical protein